MHTLTVLYGPQDDIRKFREYYEKIHLPIAKKIPGIRAAKITFDVASIDGPSPYVAMFEAEFDSEQEMIAAFASPEGKRAMNDFPNYNTGPVHLIHGPSRPAWKPEQ